MLNVLAMTIALEGAVRASNIASLASASRSAAGMVRPSFERRHSISSGNRAHSWFIR